MVADSQPGHIDQIKQTNAGAVYRLIDQLGPVSRIDLSRFAQLAPASITKIVREMLEAHLVQETEIQEPGSREGLPLLDGGNRSLALPLYPHQPRRDPPRATGFKQRAGGGRAAGTGVTARSAFASRLLDQVDQFFIRHQKKLERLTAIAVTMPGIIDTEHGINPPDAVL
ncbi:transcriptional regulator Mic [Klebsiella michiganensis]|uniref:Transcriptional regulator Mic n=1 Tax=Klebsiella michiganensis TaxID=1134687 RepID=A0A7H4MYA6_9ENTR|nr:transcriptional regulator Mic [Klebsiella michiganensis]